MHKLQRGSGGSSWYSAQREREEEREREGESVAKLAALCSSRTLCGFRVSKQMIPCAATSHSTQEKETQSLLPTKIQPLHIEEKELLI